MNARDFQIYPIDYKTAMQIIVEKHYLHRRAPCSFAFALYAAGQIFGVICYGTPSSAPLRAGICGKDESSNVIELTRLWVDDQAPRNSESRLIGNTVRKVDKEIIVSFADPTAGHVGTVYQATNWLYTGLSARRTDWHIDGVDKHGQTIADKYTAAEARELFGDRFSLRPRPQKHRYVYFNADRRRRRELMSKLRYPVMPYPKRIGCNA